MEIINSGLKSDLIKLIKNGNKIKAISLCREKTDLSLRQSKDVCDKIFDDASEAKALELKSDLIPNKEIEYKCINCKDEELDHEFPCSYCLGATHRKPIESDNIKRSVDIEYKIVKKYSFSFICPHCNNHNILFNDELLNKDDMVICDLCGMKYKDNVIIKPE